MTFDHAIVWLRRDLRLSDNTALAEALRDAKNVSLIFIFDPEILGKLPTNDRRLTFIWQSLMDLQNQLKPFQAGVTLFHGRPEEVFIELYKTQKFQALYFNHDYEPFAMERDSKIKSQAQSFSIHAESFKDHVIFEKSEIVKDDFSPYKVFTAYKNKWLQGCAFLPSDFFKAPTIELNRITTFESTIPTISFLDEIGFKLQSNILTGGESAATTTWNTFQKDIRQYDKNRDLPAIDKTSHLSPYLRFGNISVRRLVADLRNDSGIGEQTFLSELIWREFFMMILFQFPYVEKRCFNSKFDRIAWANDSRLFEAWRLGQTGFPIVDAGMREINTTGLMHNRVRMIVASFLVKHLHVDWRLGEKYFAKKLLDFELSSNNGNWQWAAGTGVDAAPYFRIFNPVTQGKKFDPEAEYIKRWVPELREASPRAIHNFELSNSGYFPPIISLEQERKICLAMYDI